MPVRSALPLFLALSCLAAPAVAEEKQETRIRTHLWRTPFYLVLGLPRDVIDAPVKGMSSIPVFKHVFIAPLFLMNIVTSYTCWSCTDEGIAGGFDAWYHSIGLGRKEGTHIPKSMRNRRWQQNYFPNWRTFAIIERVPVEKPPQ
jgi:hypothetical protein